MSARGTSVPESKPRGGASAAGAAMPADLNPRQRWHQEETTEGRRSWACIPVVDATAAALAASATDEGPLSPLAASALSESIALHARPAVPETLDVERRLTAWAECVQRLIAVAPIDAVVDETGLSGRGIVPTPHSTPPERKTLRAAARDVVAGWLARDLAALRSKEPT